MSAVRSETKAARSFTSSDGPGMTSDSSHRASIFFMHLNRAGDSLGAACMACAWRMVLRPAFMSARAPILTAM